jgi:hypothetical protein
MKLMTDSWQARTKRNQDMFVNEQPAENIWTLNLLLKFTFSLFRKERKA